MIEQVEGAAEQGKYLFIWDKSDQIDTFFKYKGFLIDFNFEQRKHEHERCSADDVIEALRGAFIKAGRQGQHLLINLDDMAPDFINTYTNPEFFATEIAFNRTEWRKEEVHKAVLKEGENYSANTENSGLYFMQPEHTMQIRSTVRNVEALKTVLSRIPNID